MSQKFCSDPKLTEDNREVGFFNYFNDFVHTLHFIKANKKERHVSMDEPKSLKNQSLRESEWDLSF